MIVDVHTHILTDDVLRAMDELASSVSVREANGNRTLTYPYGTFHIDETFYSPEARIDWMDRNGIDTSIVSVSNPEPNNRFPRQSSTELVRRINDAHARWQSSYPDRFACLGSLPLREPEAALAEIDRIVDDLGLHGVMLPTSTPEGKLSHPRLAPVFDRLDEDRIPAMIHPVHNCTSKALSPDELDVAVNVGFPADTTFELTRLMFDGFFDKHDFDLLVSHLGGALMFLAGRIERGRLVGRTNDVTEPLPEDDGLTRESPRQSTFEYLQRFYYDTIVFSRHAMELAMRTVGVESLMFGTDHPFPTADFELMMDEVTGQSFSAPERDKVFGETAAMVFDL